ncbi:MAG: riboflavin synthase [Planctomycetota bacterium]|jgi:riboflavin synthase
MFTGIVQALGTVTAVEPAAHGAVLRIDATGWSHRAAVGDSIAVDGCCLTVTDDDRSSPARGELRFDVVQETLRKTVLGRRGVGDRVNLEPAVTPSTMLSGHVVQGHIDGVGTVTAVEAGEEEWRVVVRPPEALRDYVVPTGSIAVNGVSLTVAALDATTFTVALIPTTLQLTNLDGLGSGDEVNLETDYLVKAVVSYLQRRETVARGAD